MALIHDKQSSIGELEERVGHKIQKYLMYQHENLCEDQKSKYIIRKKTAQPGSQIFLLTISPHPNRPLHQPHNMNPPDDKKICILRRVKTYNKLWGPVEWSF